MTEGILYVSPELLGIGTARAGESRRERDEQPLAPWFLDNEQLRDARSGALDRERRLRGALDQLMELFASSQITPSEFRDRLIAIIAGR